MSESVASLKDIVGLSKPEAAIWRSQEHPESAKIDKAATARRAFMPGIVNTLRRRARLAVAVGKPFARPCSKPPSMRPAPFSLSFALAVALVGSCSSAKDRRKADGLQNLLTGASRGAEDPTDLIPALIRKHGAAQRDRVEQGFNQATLLWRPEDGDRQALHSFAGPVFVSDPAQRDALLDRFEYVLEQVDGYFLDVGREMRRYSELEVGPQLPIDDVFAGLDFSAKARDAVS